MTAHGFKYSDDNKRYHTYSYHLKKRFGCRVYRAAMDIGAGCPNRCGECGYGGCIFCSDGADPRGRFEGISPEELRREFDRACAAAGEKARGKPFIAYLQSGSNTFGDISAFEEVYRRLIGCDNVVGLCIATRADCIDRAYAELLGELSRETALTVELGLQTIHDETALRCGRGHTLAQFMQGFELLRERGVDVGVHIINGLPGETHDMMVETALFVGKLRPHSVKIHMLYVEEGTTIAELYRRGELGLLSREQYVAVVCDQLELIPPETVIARLTGDGDRSRFIAPEWTLHKLPVLNAIDMELARRGTYQGAKL
ncbi:MAG: TIGR01212 family radical SAM protein [Ruminococcus sp.]|nr:TIGR01212 family radical SAM protein [Ruminococcus sp.]